MTKLVGRDRHVKAVDVAGRSYYADRKGTYEVTDKNAIAALKREGFSEASLLGVTDNVGLGFTCNECGFGSWFRKCSRCGHENESTPRTDGE